MGKQLRGVRVAVLVADGFEQVEVTLPVKALRQAGADVRILSLRPGRIRGLNFLWPGRKLAVDALLSHSRAQDYGAVLLPGGFINPDLLRQSEHARRFIQEAEMLGRPIAVICHGPELLISADLVRNRRLTSWPGIADDLRNAGAEWTSAALVQDGRWLSSRGPQDLTEFIPAMVQLFETYAAPAEASVPGRVRWVAQLSRLGMLALPLAALWAGRREIQRRRTRPWWALDARLATAAATRVAPWLAGAVTGAAAVVRTARRERPHSARPVASEWRPVMHVRP